MLKLILKNILAHRSRYCWIFIELCLVAIISWNVLDDVIVNKSFNSRPAGFDIDRLVTFKFNEFPTSAPPQASGPEEEYIAKRKEYDDGMIADMNRILDRVRTDNRVESATLTSTHCFMQPAINVNSFGSPDDNGFTPIYYIVYFWPQTDFFRTFGLTDANARDNKIFEEPSMSGRQVIASKSITDFMFPGEKGIGHFLEEHDKKADPEKYSKIVGIVNDVNYRPDVGRTPIVYKTRKQRDLMRMGGPKGINVVMRLKDGVDPDRFVRDYSRTVSTELRTESIYAHSLQTYRELESLFARDMNNEAFTGMAIALFFFINILLCMVGTFFLQTRKRMGDVGVMRSFGATRGFILREMLGEGFLLTSAAWLIGCLIYFFYLKHMGLNLSEVPCFGSGDPVKSVMPMWFDDFTTHFAVVSLIIYLIMLISVLIGIYIPARRISRINPVDALRDE